MSPAGRERVERRTSDHVRAAREWQRTHAWPSDPDYFAREVRPKLVGIPVRALVETTGLSVGYRRRVQLGTTVPHPMWWERLAAVGG